MKKSVETIKHDLFSVFQTKFSDNLELAMQLAKGQNMDVPTSIQDMVETFDVLEWSKDQYERLSNLIINYCDITKRKWNDKILEEKEKVRLFIYEKLKVEGINIEHFENTNEFWQNDSIWAKSYY